MSESIERRIIHKRITALEEQIRAEHRRWDALYGEFPVRGYRIEIQEIVDSIGRIHAELLILKGIILDADDEARLSAGSKNHDLAKTQLTPEVYVWCVCGARFDAYGDKGAMNKLADHIRWVRSASGS